jgi:lysophospholipase L1-like esterase
MQGVYKKRTHDTHMNKHLPYVQDPNNTIKTVLLGTSHFERLVWFDRKISQHVSKDTFVAGVGGDRVEHILYRLESKDGLIEAFKNRQPQPERIVLLAGGNNVIALRNPDTPEATVEKIRHVVQYLKKGLAGVTLEVWAIPRDKARSNAVDRYNRLLKDMCQQENVLYSDDVYAKSMEADNSIFHDDVHLSVRGYLQCMVPFLPS